MMTIILAFLSKYAIGIVTLVGGLIWYIIQSKNPNPFSLLKFLGGFNLFTGAVVGKWVFYLLVAIIGCHLYYNALIRPTHQTVDKSITNIDRVDKFYNGVENKPDNSFFGIKMGALKLGVGWDGASTGKVEYTDKSQLKVKKNNFNLFKFLKFW